MNTRQHGNACLARMLARPLTSKDVALSELDEGLAEAFHALDEDQALYKVFYGNYDVVFDELLKDRDLLAESAGDSEDGTAEEDSEDTAPRAKTRRARPSRRPSGVTHSQDTGDHYNQWTDSLTQQQNPNYMLVRREVAQAIRRVADVSYIQI